MGYAIIWPALLLVANIYAVWFVMFFQRFTLMKTRPPGADSFATGAKAMAYFEPVEMSANNLRNLFEMPVLFFAIVPLLLVTGQASGVQVALGWAYALLRVAHSAIHVSRGPVLPRFFVYAASCAVLLAMWIGLGIDLWRQSL